MMKLPHLERKALTLAPYREALGIIGMYLRYMLRPPAGNCFFLKLEFFRSKLTKIVLDP